MRNVNLSILLLITTIGVLAILSVGAGADPVDTTNPPTSDWIFDEGRTTTLSNKDWEVGYNITVTSGSILSIEQCDWSMKANSGPEPIWIHVDPGCSLTIDTSTLIAPDGSTGFYIQSYGDIKLTTCTLQGLVSNPSRDGGVSVYGADAYLHTVNVLKTEGATAFYAYNTTVSIWWSNFDEIDGDAIRIHLDSIASGTSLNCHIFNTTVSLVEGSGISLTTDSLYGYASLDVFDVRMDNVSQSGIEIVQGDVSASDGGNGTLHVVLEGIDLLDIGGIAISMSSFYQVSKTAGPGFFNVTMSNCGMNRVGGGIYALIENSEIDFRLDVESVDIDTVDISGQTGLQGIYLERAVETTDEGGSNITISNTTIQRAIWGGLLDMGNNNFVRFYDTSFIENYGYAVRSFFIRNYRQTPMLFERCTFVNNTGYGVRVEGEYYPLQLQVIDVIGCVFVNNSGPALAIDILMHIQATKPITVGFNVTDCIFEGPPEVNAIWIDPYRVEGMVMLLIEGTRINGTGGIFIGRSINQNMDIQVHISNSTISNSSGCSLDLNTYSSKNSKTNVTLQNLTAHSLVGGAISLANNMYQYRTAQLTSIVIIRESHLTSEEGDGLTVSTNGKHLPGVNRIVVENTTIVGAIRGIVIKGHDGSTKFCNIRGGLLEDILVIDSYIESWHLGLSGPIEEKVRVLTRGEIKLTYSIGISVLWSTGKPVVGATVVVQDNSLITISIKNVVSPDGKIPPITINSYIVQASGVVSRNPYIVNASFSGVSSSAGVLLDKDLEVTIVLTDNIAPEVHILSPESGITQQSSVLRIIGTAWDYESDISTVRLSIDGENWTTVEGIASWNHKFTVDNETIKRFGGQIIVRAMVLDNAGNMANDMIVVNIVKKPPEVTVFFPPDGFITNSNMLTVSGTTDEGAAVSINGESVEVTFTLFESDLKLVEGMNTIAVASMDVLGNTKVVRLQVILDTRPPYIILQSPVENATTNLERISVTASLEDDLDLVINDIPIPYGSDWYQTGSGILEYEVPLLHGENTIVIEASDRAGNHIRINRRVYLDIEPPWIVVEQPLEGARLSRHDVEVLGTVDPNAVLRLNGEEITTSAGLFHVSILAGEGENTIVLWAQDGAGNENILDVTFIVDTVPPHLEILSPSTDPHQVTSVRYEISGTVWADGMLTAEAVLLNDKTYTIVDDGSGNPERVELTISTIDGTFIIPVDLMEGINEFTIIVVDEAGNQASITRHIILDTISPTLSVAVEPSRVTDDGQLVSSSQNLHISGYTEPGSILTLNDMNIPVQENGTYEVYYRLTSTGTTALTIISTDSAGNERVIVSEVTYKEKVEVEDQGSAWTLPISILVCLALIIVAVFYIMYTIRRGQPTGDVGEGEEELDDGTMSGSDEHAEMDEDRRS